MNKGILIVAHNNRDVDYARLAIISGALAKKNLKLPVSLITDQSTIDWMEEEKILNDAENIFENFIKIDRPQVIENYRILHDGDKKINTAFLNYSRPSVFDYTPYDKTLLIDSDFLIFSDVLNNYWELDEDILISNGIKDIKGNRIGILDKRVSETGPNLYWATTVMFNKSLKSKLFFELVNFIKENYDYYSDLYRFDPRQYRNDISFSVANHILNGHRSIESYNLPMILTSFDKDDLVEVSELGKLTFLLSDMTSDNFTASAVRNSDIHIMNKQAIIRNYDSLRKLI